ncbi:MAG: hypothetical protein QXI19_13680 [Candidatus Caldarchaeum sp.]
MDSELTIQVFYPYDQDAVVEFWCGDTLWARVVENEPLLLLEIFPNPNGSAWVFPLDQVENQLNQARRILAEERTEQLPSDR